jgi:hypothetical protein
LRAYFKTQRNKDNKGFKTSYFLSFDSDRPLSPEGNRDFVALNILTKFIAFCLKNTSFSLVIKQKFNPIKYKPDGTAIGSIRLVCQNYDYNFERIEQI